MNKIPVSVVVSVKNEEKNLPHCLDKLNNFSEVIVVDSSSTDNTPSIVEEYNFKLINFKWNGKFPKKRNWTLDNVEILNDWVLFLDADEFLTNEFIEELKIKIESNRFSGYWLNYSNYFMSKKLNYGDKMTKLALFKKDKGRYEKIEEDSWSHLDMEVHEHPIINEDIGKINAPIIHQDYKGLEHYIARHNAYSSWEARRYINLKKRKDTSLNFRQKLKYKLIGFGILPAIYFLGAYIFKLGFLDGMAGFHLARYKSHYFYQIQTKIKEYKE